MSLVLRLEASLVMIIIGLCLIWPFMDCWFVGIFHYSNHLVVIVSLRSSLFCMKWLSMPNIHDIKWKNIRKSFIVFYNHILNVAKWMSLAFVFYQIIRNKFRKILFQHWGQGQFYRRLPKILKTVIKEIHWNPSCRQGWTGSRHFQYIAKKTRQKCRICFEWHCIEGYRVS